MAIFGFLSGEKKKNLDKGLEKTKESIFLKLSRVVAGKSTIDDEVLDKLGRCLSPRMSGLKQP